MPTQRRIQGSPAYAIDKRTRAKLQQSRMDKGLCVYCGKNPATASTHIKKPPFRFCDACRAVRRKKDVGNLRKARERRRKAGLCSYCGNVRLPEGVLRCDKCRLKSRTLTNQWRDRSRAEINRRARERYARRKAEKELNA